MKRLKNVEDKNEEQLKVTEDQGEKQLQILASKTNKEAAFKNVSFKNKLDFESSKICNDISEPNKKIDYTKLVCSGSGEHYHNFTIFLSLENFAENIYNGNLSLKAAKIKQRNMEDMIRKLDSYNPNREKCKTKNKCSA